MSREAAAERSVSRALRQKSISVVTSFVFNSCDFVDRFFCPKN